MQLVCLFRKVKIKNNVMPDLEYYGVPTLE